jgi:hypothetical protein
MTNVYVHQSRRKINVPFAVIIIEVNTFGIFYSNGILPALLAPGEECVLKIILNDLLRFCFFWNTDETD